MEDNKRPDIEWLDLKLTPEQWQFLEYLKESRKQLDRLLISALMIPKEYFNEPP